MAVEYLPHYKDRPEGHLFFDVADGPCTITLTPAASADQAWLDEKGQLIARLLNESEVKMTEAQRQALAALCERYKVPFDESHYTPQYDLPAGYVGGWIGGWELQKLYVGCSSQGEISS